MLSRHLAHFFKGSWNECYVQTLTQSCNTEREEAKHTANQYNNQHSIQLKKSQQEMENGKKKSQAFLLK